MRPINDPTSEKYSNDPDYHWGGSRWLTPKAQVARQGYNKVNQEKHTLRTPLIWVYELWSADGECLYVGKTNNLRRRRAQHIIHPDSAGGTAWREHRVMVLNMRIDPELEVIQARRPRLNINGNR